MSLKQLVKAAWDKLGPVLYVDDRKKVVVMKEGHLLSHEIEDHYRSEGYEIEKAEDKKHTKLEFDVKAGTLVNINVLTKLAGYPTRARMFREAFRLYYIILNCELQEGEVRITPPTDDNKEIDLQNRIYNLEKEYAIKQWEEEKIHRLQFTVTWSTAKEIDELVEKGGHEGRAAMFREAFAKYCEILDTYFAGGRAELIIGKQVIDLKTQVESLERAANWYNKP